VRFLVGIDDTDNLVSRGTGYRARQLGERLACAGMESLGITRHQLLVDTRIPYTSHNSSACLAVECPPAFEPELASACRQFLSVESAAGSDAGLCIVHQERVHEVVMMFGRRAKTEVLLIDEAVALSRTNGIYLVGVTGNGGGVIGALAAVGLRAGGNDGRFLWLPGLRELQGVHTISRLRLQVPLDGIETEAGDAADPNDRVLVGEWPRPVMRAGRIVLLVEEARHEEYEWMVVARSRIKEVSE
jgi:hypothetical protein